MEVPHVVTERENGCRWNSFSSSDNSLMSMVAMETDSGIKRRYFVEWSEL